MSGNCVSKNRLPEMSRLSEIDKDKVTEETSGSFNYLPQSQLPAQISSDTGASDETETTQTDWDINSINSQGPRDVSNSTVSTTRLCHSILGLDLKIDAEVATVRDSILKLVSATNSTELAAIELTDLVRSGQCKDVLGHAVRLGLTLLSNGIRYRNTDTLRSLDKVLSQLDGRLGPLSSSSSESISEDD